MNNRKRRNDLILIAAAILVAALLLCLYRVTLREGSFVNVTCNGTVTGTYPLDRDVTILLIPGEKPQELENLKISELEKMFADGLPAEYVPSGKTASETAYNLWVIRDGSADMVAASCPDHICVKQHIISKQNESITCLPNKTVLTVTGGSEEKPYDTLAQ